MTRRRQWRFLDFNNPGLWKNEHRMAVTGFSRSGKTVFLTSLISHLVYHDPNRFNLGTDNNGNPITIVNPRIVPPPRHWEPFAYVEHRKRLASTPPDWPGKTRGVSSFRIEFELSHWRFATTSLTFYDFPGERFADCSMLRSSFREWSHQRIEWMTGLVSAPREVESFLDLINRQSERPPDSSELIRCYKAALAALYARHHRHLSPSTFVLDLDGTSVADVIGKDQILPAPQEIAKTRLSGLSTAEFTPLPIRLLDNNSSEVVRQFTSHYERYRTKVVKPIFRTLAKCDSLAVLVDIAHVLHGGAHVCDDVNDFINDVLIALKPGRKLSHLPRKWLPTRFMRGAAIRRIAFVASQIDRFHYRDWDLVRDLLGQLVQRYSRAYKGADKKVFRMASVCSAISDDKEDVLYLVLPSDMTNGQVPPHTPVARVPAAWDGWPANWNPESLFGEKGGFPRLNPQMPRMKMAVPDHVDLDNVFRFLVGWMD